MTSTTYAGYPKLPASEQQTKVVTMASDLENPVRELLAEIKSPNKQVDKLETALVDQNI